MKLAIMQPYFFPYIGYFELMSVVDKFVFLTDVQYINRGWVNRNRIHCQNKPFQYLTVPVLRHSRNILIKDVKIESAWVSEQLSIFRHSFKVKKHPFLDYFSTLTKHSYLCEMLCESLMWTANFLNLKCEFALSEGISTNQGQQRILDICNHFGATEYFNLSGGKDLYQESNFEKIQLKFMNPSIFPNHFSIIELLLTEEKNVKDWLNEFVIPQS